MPVATSPTDEDMRRARERAEEWRSFRKQFLYSQGNLAQALRCSRRTVSAVESGREVFNPGVGLLRRFCDLKLRYERAAAMRTKAVA